MNRQSPEPTSFAHPMGQPQEAQSSQELPKQLPASAKPRDKSYSDAVWRTVLALFLLPHIVSAQGFDKINTTLINVSALLTTIAVVVVTIALIWVGYKMIFHGARITDIANVLIGGTIIGGASAFAAYIVN